MLTKVAFVLGLLCAVAGGAWLAKPRPAATAEAAQSPVAQTVQFATDPVRAADALIRRLQQTPFAGTIDFELSIQRWPGGRAAGGEPEMIRQLGRIYVGGTDKYRLDLWTGPLEAPIVCALNGRRVWMVWRDNRVVMQSALPVPEQATGWLGQLRMQAGQTVAMAHLLLHAGFLPSADISIASASRDENGDLVIRIPTGGDSAAAGPASVLRAQFSRELSEFVPVGWIYSSGASRTFSEYLDLGPHGAIPSVLGHFSDRVIEELRVTDTNMRPPRDALLVHAFDPPEQSDPAWATIAASVFYAPDGTEHIQAWPR
ncbi:MAG: hypothetical protein AB1716_10700 [Planctomycetota bacterium]